MRLSVQQAGAGPPVLLLHGLFGQARNLARVQARLAPTHRVAAMDLRNHGSSPHAPGMDYASLAADVAETLDAIGMARCAVIGHSMGGKVAMRLALDAPARVERLLVGDIAPATYTGSFAAYGQAMRALALPSGLTRSQADAALSPAVPDAPVRGFLLQNLSFDPHPFWRIGLEEILAGLPQILGWQPAATQYDGPTLFLAGEHSDYVTPSHLPAIEARFPTARIRHLPDAGHWLHVDNPAGFMTAVSDFLCEPQTDRKGLVSP